MTPIDPSTLPALPAPLWFIEAFKIVGFVLHCIPMGIWFVGLPIALVMYLSGRRNSRRFARRIFKQMPIVMALGVNFGIVPLLFIQTAYYKPFYTSTILMAVHWFAILLLVCVAYYMVYACASLVETRRRRMLVLCCLTASLCLAGVGLIFAAQWTFMASPENWPAVFEKKSVACAATGLGTWWRDQAVYLRWISMVGLGFTTLAFWTFFDSRLLCRARSFVSDSSVSASSAGSASSSEGKNDAAAKLSKKEKRRLKKAGGKSDDNFDEEYAALEAAEREEEEESVDSIENYRAWALSLATCLSWFGFLLAASALGFYYYRVVKPGCPDLAWLFESNWQFLPLTTIGALALFPIILTLGKWEKLNGVPLVLAVTACEVAILALFATTRQFIQNGQLASWLDISAIPQNPDWGMLYTFLGCFALTLLVVMWIIRQMVVAGRPAAE